MSWRVADGWRAVGMPFYLVATTCCVIWSTGAQPVGHATHKSEWNSLARSLHHPPSTKGRGKTPSSQARLSLLSPLSLSLDVTDKLLLLLCNSHNYGWSSSWVELHQWSHWAASLIGRDESAQTFTSFYISIARSRTHLLANFLPPWDQLFRFSSGSQRLISINVKQGAPTSDNMAPHSTLLLIVITSFNESTSIMWNWVFVSVERRRTNSNNPIWSVCPAPIVNQPFGPISVGQSFHTKNGTGEISVRFSYNLISLQTQNQRALFAS